MCHARHGTGRRRGGSSSPLRVPCSRVPKPAHAEAPAHRGTARPRTAMDRLYVPGVARDGRAGLRSRTARLEDRRGTGDRRMEPMEEPVVNDNEPRPPLNASPRGGRTVIADPAGVAGDATHFKRLESELLEKNALLESVLENVDACIYTKDRQRRYTYANAKMAAV